MCNPFRYFNSWHCQSKFVYFAKTSEPDFAAIDFPAFFRVDLSGSMAAPSIQNFALTMPVVVIASISSQESAQARQHWRLSANSGQSDLM
jgi:hypothetical protein